MNRNDNLPKFYPLADLCKILSISKSTAFREIKSGKLIPIIIGSGRLRFTEESIKSYLNACSPNDLNSAI